MKKFFALVVLVLAMVAPSFVSACSHGAPPTPPPEQNDFGA